MTRFLAALAPFALITTPLTAQDDSLAPAAPPERDFETQLLLLLLLLPRPSAIMKRKWS